jgi:hypothetical protein
VTKILVWNTAPVSIHKPFIFENNTITLFPDPDLTSKVWNSSNLRNISYPTFSEFLTQIILYIYVCLSGPQ